MTPYVFLRGRRGMAQALIASGGGGGGEPSFNAGTQSLILQDDLDSYASFIGTAPRWTTRYPSFRVSDNAGGFVPDGSIEPTYISFPTGRGGSGKCIRLAYGIGFASDVVIGPVGRLDTIGAWNGTLPQKAAPYTHFFFSQYFRTSVGADPADVSWIGIKGFMFAHTNNQRYESAVNQVNFDDPLGDAITRGPKGCNPGNWYTGLNLYRTANGRAPLWSLYNDGNWHKYTIEIYAGTDPSGHKGQRIWLDSVLTYDDVDQPVGSGTLADHYDYDFPIIGWNFWGNFANTGDDSNPFTIDFDDWTAWTD